MKYSGVSGWGSLEENIFLLLWIYASQFSFQFQGLLQPPSQNGKTWNNSLKSRLLFQSNDSFLANHQGKNTKQNDIMFLNNLCCE